MKWKEFIELAKKSGVKDDDEIWYIDFAFDDQIEFHYTEKLGWAVG